MLGFLRSIVEENASVDTNDMIPLKRSLGRLGYYKPTEAAGLHEFPDEPMFAAIRKFQKNKGLKVDGLIRPGGPTEIRLLQRVSEKAPNAKIPPLGLPYPNQYGDPDATPPLMDNWLGDRFREVSDWLRKQAPGEPPAMPKYDSGGGRRDPGTLSTGIHYRPKPSNVPAQPRPNPHPPNRPKAGKPMM